MKKVLYFDAFNGVAGDMIVGALIDLGVPFDYLQQELGKLKLDGYRLQAAPIERQGLFGTNFTVELPAAEDSGDHHHHHDQTGHGHSHHHHSGGHPHGEEPHRSFSRIRTLISESDLSEAVKVRSTAVFERLGRAEAAVHRSTLEEVHFHEVGAVDSIVDIVGACIGFDYLAVEEFYSSTLALGGGTVTFSHGTWPVPAPATVELVKGFPTRLGGEEGELTTPTGAALVTALVEPFRQPPPFRVIESGFGAGDRELLNSPNMLRLLLGERAPVAERERSEAISDIGVETVALLEANIDDMDAEMFGHFLDTALHRGALDVTFAPIQMKKSRPGTLVSVLCRPEDRERFATLLFQETTTLGLRVTCPERWFLERETLQVDTEYGRLRCKVGKLGDRVLNLAPEYEDLKEIAAQTGQPLKEIRLRVMKQLSEIER